KTGGRSLAAPAESAREQLSAEMNFEGAALMHQRLQRIQDVLGFRDEMVRELDNLNAITIAPSTEPDAVVLGWLRGGAWHGFSRMEFNAADGTSVSLDARLRELVQKVESKPSAGMKRMEHLATIARWFYSSW